MSPPTRRKFLYQSSVIGLILTGGCGSLQFDKPDEIPILVENRTDVKHEIVIEISDNKNNLSEAMIVNPHESVIATELSGDFCIRVFIPSVDNSKDVTCPETDESDYSRKGYTVIIYPEDNPGPRSEIVHIVPNSEKEQTSDSASNSF